VTRAEAKRQAGGEEQQVSDEAEEADDDNATLSNPSDLEEIAAWVQEELAENSGAGTSKERYGRRTTNKGMRVNHCRHQSTGKGNKMNEYSRLCTGTVIAKTGKCVTVP